MMDPEPELMEENQVDELLSDSEDDRPESPEVRVRVLSLLRKYWWLILFPLFAVIVLYLGAYTGYQEGLIARNSAEVTEEAQSLLEQFNLGVEDFTAGRYDLALQRAEYILSVDPENEAAIGLLDLALQALNRPTLTPTLEVTPTVTTPTPTPDLSSIEATLSEANAAIDRGDWSVGLGLLIRLRAENPDYRSDEIDKLMFKGLRNRGLERILSGFLEQGIYDLSLAERFEILDNQALSWRGSAEFYLFANSFIGLDWAQAYQWFSQLCGAAIWDSCYKYASSAHGYGDNLVATEDSCGALVPYDQSLLTFFNEELVPTATEAAVLCMTATAPTPTPTETPTLEGTITLTPDGTITLTPDGTGTPPPPVTDTPSLTPSMTPSLTPTMES
jgi:tetratricopeptide (TPR) repeat protein